MVNIEELRNEYIKNTEANKTNIYAQLGLLGVSPKHLKMYEESIAAIEEYRLKLED